MKPHQLNVDFILASPPAPDAATMSPATLRTGNLLPKFLKSASLSRYSKSCHNITSLARNAQRSFPSWFVRGGTSNGLVIRRDHLPPETQWPSTLPAAMGSPDPNYGRQLDGMGSGLSSTSKIVILGAPSRDDVDVEFTFVQVGIRDGGLDMAGNCGNMSSIVGPAAWDQGLVDQEKAVVEKDDDGQEWAEVRILNTNTSKVMKSRFKVAGSPLKYCPHGDYIMDGVPGTGSMITMSFLDPAGAKTGKALPTGNPIDTLTLPDGSAITASLVDVGNPGVFVSTESLGLDAAAATPAAIEGNARLKTKLEHIRRAGTSRMGLDPNVESVPKIVLLFPASETPGGVDIRCAAMSMGQAHKAVPLTLALCLGVSARIPGTLAAELLATGTNKKPGGAKEDAVTIAHPSGMVDVGTKMEDGKILEARLLRTARVMMKGDVYY